jgi:hypothetical protein
LDLSLGALLHNIMAGNGHSTRSLIFVATYLPVFLLEETYSKVIIARRKQKQEAAETNQPKLKTDENAGDRANRHVSQLICRLQLRSFVYLFC